ncbi:MAG: CRISPR-associated endonuclease Cas3'' [Acidilobaceae archaeon]
MCDLEWPLAYAEVTSEGRRLIISLGDHLSNTTELALCMFNNDLRVLSKRASVGEDMLTKILALSTGLHDIGKASRYYCKRQDASGKLTFPYHEFLSALFLYILSWLSLGVSDSRLACIFRTSAKIVSRHHSSMPKRHPSNYTDENLIRIVRDAVQEVEGSDIMRALQPLSHNTQIRSELKIINSKINDIIPRLKNMRASEIGSVIENIAKLSSNPRDMCDAMNELVVVRAITGFLIIADNIVASRERRGTSDSPIPAYIGSWNRELERRLRGCNWVFESF